MKNVFMLFIGMVFLLIPSGILGQQYSKTTVEFPKNPVSIRTIGNIVTVFTKDDKCVQFKMRDGKFVAHKLCEDDGWNTNI